MTSAAQMGSDGGRIGNGMLARQKLAAHFDTLNPEQRRAGEHGVDCGGEFGSIVEQI
jgi:hypothetical protein